MLPNSAVTREEHYLRRREFLRVFGLGLAASALSPQGAFAASSGFPDSINPAFKLDGVKLTPEDSVTSYNNFYEWGFAKDEPNELANRGWKTEPWSLEVGGLCANPAKIDIGGLIKLVGGIERRNYRHRCVEAVLVGRHFVPGCLGLFGNELNLHQRFRAFESVLPRDYEADRCTVLIPQRLAVKTGGEKSELIPRFGNRQAFRVRPR